MTDPSVDTAWKVMVATMAVTDPPAYRRLMAEAEQEAAKIGRRKDNGAVVSEATIKITQLVKWMRDGYDS